MVVDRTDYIMIGADISFLDIDFYDDFDKWQPYLEGHEDVEYTIMDTKPMRKGGKWLFGKIIDMGDKYDGLDLNIIDEHDYILDKQRIEEKTMELGLYNDEYSIGEEDVHIIVFTQWH